MSHTALYRLGGVLTLAVPVLVALIVAIALTDGLTAVCAPTSTSPCGSGWAGRPAEP